MNKYDLTYYEEQTILYIKNNFGFVGESEKYINGEKIFEILKGYTSEHLEIPFKEVEKWQVINLIATIYVKILPDEKLRGALYTTTADLLTEVKVYTLDHYLFEIKWTHVDDLGEYDNTLYKEIQECIK